MESFNNYISGLKSDHFGIETSFSSINLMNDSELKSDHFGIETRIFEDRGVPVHH